MDILIPLGIGFVMNAIIFGINLLVRITRISSLKITFFSFLLTLIASFLISFVGSPWYGMGLGVISLGMLAFWILLLITNLFLQLNKKKEILN